MFKGDRLLSITAGLALIVAFAVGGYILGFGLGEQSGEYKANTDTYAKHAQDEIKHTCVRLNGVAYTECIIGVVEATNENERSEGDLNAQRNMARWALWMLVATIAMAVITAGGVYYVWKTLKVTRDIGEAQTRAYIGIQDVDISNVSDGSYAKVSYKIINSGNSPAIRINGFPWATLSEKQTMEIVPESRSLGPDYNGSMPSGVERQGSVRVKIGDIDAPTRARDIDDLKTGRKRISFGVKLDYEDVFGNTYDIDCRYVIHRSQITDSNSRMSIVRFEETKRKR